MNFNLYRKEAILFLLSIDTIQSSYRFFNRLSFSNFPSPPVSRISKLTIQTICPPIIACRLLPGFI